MHTYKYTYVWSGTADRFLRRARDMAQLLSLSLFLSLSLALALARTHTLYRFTTRVLDAALWLVPLDHDARSAT